MNSKLKSSIELAGPFMGLILVITIMIGLAGCTEDEATVGPQEIPAWGEIESAPEAHTYFATDFISDEIGWLVGQDGVVIRTDDGGVTWFVLNPKFNYNFHDVFFFDADTGLVVGNGGTIMRTVKGGVDGGRDGDEGWRLIKSPTPIKNLFAITFIDNMFGWIVGEDGRILETKNGGRDWVIVGSPSVQNLRSVAFTDTVGVAVGDNGVILRTTGSGSTWSAWQLVDTRAQDLRAVTFATDALVWAVGADDAIVHSEDAGLTWTDQVTGTVDASFNDVRFASASEGWVAGDEGLLLHTDDIGITWDTVALGHLDPLYTIDITPSGNTAFTAGRFTIMKNISGKNDWSNLTSNSENLPSLHAIEFVSPTIGWAVGQSGNIIKTVDSGATWNYLNRQDNTWFYDVQFLDSLTGWVVGHHGSHPYTPYIMRTDDGGHNWTAYSSMIDTTNLVSHPCDTCNITVFSVDSTWINTIAMINDTVGWAVGGKWTSNTGGVVLQTSNGGTDWHFYATAIDTNVDTVYKISNNDSTWIDTIWVHDTVWTYDTTFANEAPRFHGADFIGPDTGWVVGANGTVMYTEDHGAIWTTQAENHNYTLFGLTMIDKSTGWAVGESGTVLHTSDGVTWVPQASGVTKDLSDVVFLDAFSGWAVGSMGTVIFTDDGGDTWRVQRSTTREYLLGIEMISETIGWVVGVNGVLMNTTTGGVR